MAYEARHSVMISYCFETPCPECFVQRDWLAGMGFKSTSNTDGSFVAPVLPRG